MLDQEKQLTLMNEQKKVAAELVKSALVPAHFKNPADAWFAIMLGGEMGFSPIYSLMNISVINGKTFMAADALLAKAKSHPEYAGMTLEYDDNKATCEMHRSLANGTKDTVKTSFTIEQARQAGLASKNNWKQYPARMLRARVVGYACRELFADVLASIYTIEEAEEIAEKPAGKTATTMAAVAVAKAKAKAKEDPAPAPVEAEYELVPETKTDPAQIPELVKAFTALLDSVSLVSSDIDYYRQLVKNAVINQDVATIEHVIQKLAKISDEQTARASARPSRAEIAYDRAKKIIEKQPEPEQDELLTKAIHLYNAHDADALDALADELLKRPKPVEGLGFDDALPPAAEGVIDAINQLLAAGYNKVHAANSIRKHFPEIGLKEDNDWQAAILAATVDEEYLKKMEKHYQQAAKGAAKNTNPVKDNDANEIARLVVEIDKILTDDAVEVTPEMERLFTESTIASLQTLKAMVAAPAAQVKNINKLLKQKGLKLESFAPGYADASLLGAKLANEVEEKLKQSDDF